MRTSKMTAVLLTQLFMLPLAGSALADAPAASLAPPGPCAEPRETTAFVAPSNPTRFDVIGPLPDLFDLVDVAASPSDSGLVFLTTILDRPMNSPRARPGSCEAPGTGCGLAPAGVGAINPPIIAGGRPTPQ